MLLTFLGSRYTYALGTDFDFQQSLLLAIRTIQVVCLNYMLRLTE
jgi:hypothetical protein